MIIEVAKNAGFCFGVDRAVDSVYRLIDENPKRNIYTLGNLIHNPTICEDLEEKNVRVISEDDLDKVFAECNEDNPCTVVVRAHGVTKDVYEKLEDFSNRNSNFNMLDCACPYVKKIHKIVKDNAGEDTLLYVYGDPNHPEVKGIVSFAKGEVVVFSNVAELEKQLASDKNAQKKVIVVSQTTQNLTEWKKTQKILEKVYTNSYIFDTICSVTENRQIETELLAQKVDFMVIIGGRNSSNTNKLFDTARKYQPNTVLVENATELRLDLFRNNMKVGISAGASTPGSIIEEVKNKMSENTMNNIEKDLTQQSFEINDENSFAAMLEESFKTLNTGEIVKGTVLAVNSNEVQVDLGAKVTGIVPYSEVSENPSVKLEEEFKVGDEIEVMVTRVSDIDGVASLSKKRVDAITNWKNVVESFNEGKILTGKVTEIVRGGVIVVAEGQKLFVPASHSGLAKDADLSVLKGTEQRVKIIDINEQRRRAVASIRIVAREEKKAAEEAFWASIEKDKKYDGVVKSITNYGVFVDLGGVDGMIHSTELAWTHFKHPSEIVSIGEKLTVYVKDFDAEAKRISLGYKTEENNPWNIFVEKYAVGDVATVKVVNMMPFGAFAEVIPGVDGLIHISQIADKKINKPADILELGQEVDAKITDIDTENHKISLSIRALIEEAKAAEEAMPEDYIPDEEKEEAAE
ncbi:MAG: bifunctional 4-hydroxy-3-methylbut-2-enyl diphosphate reductase/30S ribosomal protein S1 [Ruminococcaceae bacterium]|nr:bifunctional 4-hydroxy-3-methylbut-2-enyl diphosphate reductase/30S ribosomal protein S1 [Oscillospiraceae bacterium]